MFSGHGFPLVELTESPYNELVNIRVIIEQRQDGFVAYPVGMKGVVVADGETYDEALANVKSAIRFHMETFGADAFAGDDSVLQVSVEVTDIAV